MNIYSMGMQVKDYTEKSKKYMDLEKFHSSDRFGFVFLIKECYNERMSGGFWEKAGCCEIPTEIFGKEDERNER